MVDNLERRPTGQDVWNWKNLCDQIKPLQEQEMLLRRFLFKGYFPNNVEGTATTDLGAGWQLKGQGKVTRNVDQAVLSETSEELQKKGLPLGLLFTFSPKLVLKEYKKLTQEQKDLLSDVITEKAASPTLTLVPPKAE